MKIFYSCSDLPENNEYVLVYCPNKPWLDDKDFDNKRFWRVAKFVKGISKEERKIISKGVSKERSLIFKSEDEHGNNDKNYCWEEFGPDCHFGQEVKFWARLPIIKMED